MGLGGTFGAWLALGRVSNLPTTWTHVWTGMCLGVAAGVAASPVDVVRPSAWAVLDESLAMLLGMSFFYVGGMILNDVVDVGWDCRHRPDRPLAAGRVGVGSASAAVWVCFGVGFGFLLLHERAAVALFGAVLLVGIVLYDVVHKWTAWSAVLMGGCRALVYLTAGSAVAELTWTWWWLVGTAAGGSGLYVAVVTLVARHEGASMLRGRGWFVAGVGLLMGAPVVGAVLLMQQAGEWGWEALVMGLVVVGWVWWCGRWLLGERVAVGRAVGGWLAGLCLIDALWLGAAGWWGMALVAVCGFLLARGGQRVVSGV